MAEEQAIRWVGEQRLMGGYCGRATVGRLVVADRPPQAAAPVKAGAATARADGQAIRPVVAVKPAGVARDRVVRVGPGQPHGGPSGQSGDRAAA